MRRLARRGGVALLWLLGGFSVLQSAWYLGAQGARGRFHAESPWLLFVAYAMAFAFATGRRAESHPAGARKEAAVSLGLLLAFVALSAGLYAPAVGIGFLSDDFVLRTRALSGRAFTPDAGEFWRPLPTALFGVLPPAALHCTNIALHGLNGWLVARLAARLWMTAELATMAGLLLVTFPANAEAVAWCSGIQDVLVTTLALGFVLAWSMEAGLAWRGFAACGLLAAALLTKETALAFPFLGLVLWARRSRSNQHLVLAIVTVGVVAFYAAQRLFTVGIPASYAQPVSRGLLKELLVRPFAALAVPWHADFGTIGAILGVAAAAGLGLGVVRAAPVWRTDRASLVLALRSTAWVPLAAAPVYSMFFVAGNLQGSRYLYLPQVGWCLLVAELLATATAGLRSPRRAHVGAAAALICLGAIGVTYHVRPWVEAGRLRDRIIAEAERADPGRTCGDVSFAGLPDSVRGAYVFRNGFDEATRPRPRGGTPVCRFRWNGRVFQRS